MSGDVKLAMCPFCGCDPVFAYSSGSVSGVRCPQCDARTGYCDQQQAIAAWNRRSSSAAERAVVEARREALEEAARVCEARAKLHEEDCLRLMACDHPGLAKFCITAAFEAEEAAAAIRALSSVRGEATQAAAAPDAPTP